MDPLFFDLKTVILFFFTIVIIDEFVITLYRLTVIPKRDFIL